MRVRLKVRSLLLLVAAAGLALGALRLMPWSDWSTSLCLDVRLVGPPSRRPVKLWHGTADAEPARVLAAPRGGYPLISNNQPPGESVVVLVWCHGRDSLLGTSLSYRQERSLLLEFEYDDGTTAFRVLPIPDLRTTHRLDVPFP